jgi:hypothetical protein
MLLRQLYCRDEHCESIRRLAARERQYLMNVLEALFYLGFVFLGMKIMYSFKIFLRRVIKLLHAGFVLLA